MLEVQLQWIRNLHDAIRSPWVDSFFKAWDYADTGYFVIIVVALVWYLWDRRIGIRLFYIFIFSLVLNKLLKELVHQPRPCQIDPLVAVICSTSPGFPSGAAQTATILCGLVFIESRRTLYRWLAFLFAFFLCFSRVYLGVHYPTDILGGIAVGIGLLLIYSKVFPLFNKNWKWASLVFPFVPLLLGIAFNVSWTYVFLLTLGVAAGLITYDKLNIQKVTNLRTKIWQAFVVVGGFFILFALEAYVPSLWMLWNFGTGYWLSFLGAWLVQKKWKIK